MVYLELLPQYLARGTEKSQDKTSTKIISVPDEIQNRHISDTILERYYFTSLLGVILFSLLLLYIEIFLNFRSFSLSYFILATDLSIIKILTAFVINVYILFSLLPDDKFDLC